MLLKKSLILVSIFWANVSSVQAIPPPNVQDTNFSEYFLVNGNRMENNASYHQPEAWILSLAVTAKGNFFGHSFITCKSADGFPMSPQLMGMEFSELGTHIRPFDGDSAAYSQGQDVVLKFAIPLGCVTSTLGFDQYNF